MLAWCQGFLEVVDRKESMRADMWKARAHHVDIIARWTIPSGFVVFIAVLYQMDEESLTDLSTDAEVQSWQPAFYCIGLLPLALACAGGCALNGVRCCKRKPSTEAPQQGTASTTSGREKWTALKTKIAATSKFRNTFERMDADGDGAPSGLGRVVAS